MDFLTLTPLLLNNARETLLTLLMTSTLPSMTSLNKALTTSEEPRLLSMPSRAFRLPLVYAQLLHL